MLLCPSESPLPEPATTVLGAVNPGCTLKAGARLADCEQWSLVRTDTGF